MRKVLLILNALSSLFFCSSFSVSKKQHAFQQSPPRFQSRVSTTTALSSPSSFHRRQQIRHSPPSLILQHGEFSPSRLCAFGGFGSPTKTNTNTNPPIESKRDIAKRIQLITTTTVKQFASGFTNGYLLALAWGVIRGPSLTVESRAMAWGLDLAVLPTLFSCTNSVSQLVLALPTNKAKKNETESGSGSGSGSGADDVAVTLLNRKRKVSLCTTVIRNMIIGIYFSRNRGVVGMARSSVLSGALSYFFVKKLKKSALLGGGANGPMGSMLGGGANGMGGGGANSKAMQQLVAQMMAAQANNGSVPPSSATTGTRPSSPQRVPSPQKPPSENPSSSSSSPLFSEKKKKAVDVEFEKIDVTDEDEKIDDTDEDSILDKNQT